LSWLILAINAKKRKFITPVNGALAHRKQQKPKMVITLLQHIAEMSTAAKLLSVSDWLYITKFLFICPIAIA